MSELQNFATAVQGLHGSWSEPPSMWSYSSLKEAEECPRRWMLSRAAYPEVWERGGYPSRPILPNLAGEAMHGALELILRAFAEQGCESVGGACAVQVLKAAGGYSGVLESAINRQLVALEANPRMSPRLSYLRSELQSRIPDMRRRIQSILTRTKLKATQRARVDGHSAERRGALAEGSHPEVELRRAGLRFVGRADLITIDGGKCTITDYKTGAPNPRHADQLNAYALLWTEDREVNAHGIPIKELIVAYATHDEVLAPPTRPDLDEFTNDLVHRIADAETQLRLRPPQARPAIEMCGQCSVRHMCDDYWEGPASQRLLAPSSEARNFVDAEATILEQNGPRSWIVQCEPSREAALLRTPTETPAISVGERVRILDLLADRDGESGSLTLTMTLASETFLLESQRFER